jgi:hypothetical protein
VFQKRSSLIGSDTTVPNVDDVNGLALAPAFEASSSVERQQLEDSGVEWQPTAPLSKMLGIELSCGGNAGRRVSGGTPLEPRRLSWRDLNSTTLRVSGVRRRCGRPLSFSELGRSGCDLYVTYRSKKWSGRLDSNQRPPAPKATWGGLGKCCFPNDLQRLPEGVTRFGTTRAATRRD